MLRKRGEKGGGEWRNGKMKKRNLFVDGEEDSATIFSAGSWSDFIKRKIR